VIFSDWPKEWFLLGESPVWSTFPAAHRPATRTVLNISL
jgi:hypothetical protein